MIPAMEKAYRAIQADRQGYWAYIAIVGRSVIPPALLPETRITDEALRLLKQHAHERFMITVSWSPPHDLWTIPEPYYSMVDRRKVELRGRRDPSDWCTAGFSQRLGNLAGDEGLRDFRGRLLRHGEVHRRPGGPHPAANWIRTRPGRVTRV